VPIKTEDGTHAAAGGGLGADADADTDMDTAAAMASMMGFAGFGTTKA
jgi:hypothetical protein